MNYIKREYKAIPEADLKVVERFLSHINCINDATSCWEWTGALDRDGYGIFAIAKGKVLRAPRVMWQLFKSELPKGLCVTHECDNRKCVRPTHTRLGTMLDNGSDSAKRNRMAHGEQHHFAKLTFEQVSIIRTLYKAGIVKQQALAVMFKVSKGTISQLICNKAWKQPKPVPAAAAVIELKSAEVEVAA